MALSKEKLKSDIRKILDLSTDGQSNTDAALEQLATAIHNYVLSAQLQGTTTDGKVVTGKLI